MIGGSEGKIASCKFGKDFRPWSNPEEVACSLDRIRALPKVELHLHLEGSLRPSLLRFLAHKNSVSLPPPGSGGEEILYSFEDFTGFLTSFRQVCRLLCRPEDLVCVAAALFDELIAENILYAEIFLSPVIYPTLGWSVMDAMPEIHAAAREREKQSGLECRFLFDSVRQWGRKAMEETVRLAEECRPWGVVGIGIGGDESSTPASELADLFHWARKNGLHTTAHAGEIGGAGNVRETWEQLQPERIGHGLGAVEDPRLLEELKRSKTTLDLCLTSNRRTGAWKELTTHPIVVFYKNQVPFTINTDDPGIFATSLSRELKQAFELLSAQGMKVGQLIRQAVAASFLDEDQKTLLLNRLEGGLQGHPF